MADPDQFTLAQPERGVDQFAALFGVNAGANMRQLAGGNMCQVTS
ncbi:hypothetical protein VQ045_21140 [Aurantimonas sp. E1-2-R+4]